MENTQKKIWKNEYNMLYDEEFILLIYSRLIKDSLFCTFSVTLQFGTISGANDKPTQGSDTAEKNNNSDIGTKVGWDSSVGIATCYGVDIPAIKS